MSPAGAPFSTRALVWLAGIGVVSLALAFVLTGVAHRFGGPLSAGADAFSKSAVGHRGLVEFLEASGANVRIRRNPSGSSPPGELWLLLEPPPRHVTAPDEFDPVADVLEVRWLEDAPIVLVPPKWSGSEDPLRPGRVVDVGRIPSADATLPFGSLETLTGTPLGLADGGREISEECESAWGERYRLIVERPRVLDGASAAAPILTCGDRVLAGIHPYPEGGASVVLIADPDLLSNHGLGRGDHARFVLDLVDRYGRGDVLVDETVHGFALEGGVIAEMFRFPLILLVVQGVVLAGAWVWAGAFRFGAARPSDPPLGTGRRVLIGNVADLIAVVGRSADLLPRYRRQTVRAVARHYGLADRPGADEVERRLAEIERGRGVAVRLASLRADATSAESGGRAGERALEAANRLHRWRREMTHVD